MSLHITGDQICFFAVICWAIWLQGKATIAYAAFCKLYKEKHGSLPTKLKDYWNV